MRDDFVMMILSHGRPEQCHRDTWHSLDKYGYTGNRLIVLDDEDESRDRYEEIFGAENIAVFHKDDSKVDLMDNDTGRGVVVYARNEAPRIAAERGYTYFMEVDDDYDQWIHRRLQRREDDPEEYFLGYVMTRHLDEVLEAFIDLLEETGALTVAMAQGGDYIGGIDGGLWSKGLARKAMNTFICRVDAPVEFMGRLNEDVNAYVTHGARGDVLLTATDFAIHQGETQKNKGGLTEAYLELGTYRKSFYSVMTAPSAVKVGAMGEDFYRLHHSVNWGRAVPKILSDRWRKPRPGLADQRPGAHTRPGWNGERRTISSIGAPRDEDRGRGEEETRP